MNNKEKNFVSAVFYLHNDAARVVPFVSELNAQLDAHFDQYELVAVDDNCTDGTVDKLREWAKGLAKPLTILHMSLRQGTEQCMNAGLDCAIGDYVLEFDSVEMQYEAGLIWQAYETAQRGNDIVSVRPSHSSRTSKWFYKIFNKYSRSAYEVSTDAFRLVSRRAINRVHAISDNLPYRKAAYATSGLKMAVLDFEGYAKTENDRFDLAVNSLVLYTDAGYKISLGIAECMMWLALAELLYTLYIYLFGGYPVEGWTTTMFVLTVGFAGVFAILSIIIKYLSLLVDLVFKKQKYMVESIEKIQK